MTNSNPQGFSIEENSFPSREPQEYTNCKSLWRMVIMQAIIDIRSHSSKYLNNIHRIKAIQWINMSNKDFLRVCQMADIEPKKVCEHRDKIINI